MLLLKDVSKSYPHPKGPVPVLSHLDLKVEHGQKIAILGPSGSGKSTLLALLAGLDRPTSGQIILDGEDLTRLSEEELTSRRTRKIGIVFQQFHLIPHLTALENVALPLRIQGERDPRERATDALAAVGLAHRLAHFPHEMSGGENQRTAIARAMVGRPPLILADEPSGNLDAATGDQVMGQLFEAVTTSHATLILVTHNPNLATWCDRQLTLKNGALHP